MRTRLVHLLPPNPPPPGDKRSTDQDARDQDPSFLTPHCSGLPLGGEENDLLSPGPHQSPSGRESRPFEVPELPQLVPNVGGILKVRGMEKVS